MCGELWSISRNIKNNINIVRQIHRLRINGHESTPKKLLGEYHIS